MLHHLDGCNVRRHRAGQVACRALVLSALGLRLSSRGPPLLRVQHAVIGNHLQGVALCDADCLFIHLVLVVGQTEELADVPESILD